jgi:hypothetical protein
MLVKQISENQLFVFWLHNGRSYLIYKKWFHKGISIIQDEFGHPWSPETNVNRLKPAPISS